MTLCLVYIILILVYMDRGSVIWGELEEPGKWGFEEFSKLGKRKRGNLWSGVVWFVGKFWFLSFFLFGRRFEMGFFSTILGFCGFGFGISIGLVASYFLFIYFQPIDVEVPLYLSVSLWMFFCMYGHVLRKIYGLVCVVLIKIITFFFWCIWLLVAVIDLKKKKKILDAVLGWWESKTKWKKKKWSPNAYEYMVWLLLFDNVGALVWSFVLVCCCLENGCD